LLPGKEKKRGGIRGNAERDPKKEDLISYHTKKHLHTEDLEKEKRQEQRKKRLQRAVQRPRGKNARMPGSMWPGRDGACKDVDGKRGTGKVLSKHFPKGS